MNSKRGFKRITFVLAAITALSGTAIGVNEVIACYKSAGWYTVYSEDYSGIEPPYGMIGTIDRAEQARAELRRRAAIRELERRGQTVAPGAQPTPTGGGSFIPDTQPATIDRDRWYKMSDLEKKAAIQAYNLKNKNECESGFWMQLSKGSLVGLCVAAGLAGGLAGFSLTWLVIWFGGLTIYKFIKWLILGFCDDVNSKQVESMEAR